MHLAEIKSIYHQELASKYPKEEIDSFFYLSIEHFLKLERFVLVMQPGYAITKEEEQPLFETLSRLKHNEPLQYILGKADFMDFSLKVNEHTLIPRPETEGLVNWVIEDNQREPFIDTKEAVENLKILDIGTGSGCIAIALAKALPEAEIHALDISGRALEVAQQNAYDNEVKVTFEQADILDVNLNLGLGFKFDIIISNPPYVRESEKSAIHENVKNHEPPVALFVPDNDALKMFGAIAEFAGKYLKKQGKLYLEINQYLRARTKSFFEEQGYSEVTVKKDIFDNYRMLRCKK